MQKPWNHHFAINIQYIHILDHPARGKLKAKGSRAVVGIPGKVKQLQNIESGYVGRQPNFVNFPAHDAPFFLACGERRASTCLGAIGASLGGPSTGPIGRVPFGLYPARVEHDTPRDQDRADPTQGVLERAS